MANILLPDPGPDFEYVKVPRKKEEIVLLREKHDRLKAELSSTPEPTKDELIEFAVKFHPYYDLVKQLAMIKAEINLLDGS